MGAEQAVVVVIEEQFTLNLDQVRAAVRKIHGTAREESESDQFLADLETAYNLLAEQSKGEWNDKAVLEKLLKDCSKLMQEWDVILQLYWAPAEARLVWLEILKGMALKAGMPPHMRR